MTGIHLASLRVRLIVFALLALLPSAGLLYYNAAERRKDAAHDVRIEGLRLIDRTSAECQRLLDGSHELLMVMAQTPEVRSLDRASCGTLFRRILPGNPQYLNF